MVPWVGMQCVIVVFPGHTHFLHVFFVCVKLLHNYNGNLFLINTYYKTNMNSDI